MLVEQTHIEGCFVITPSVFEDYRGIFFEHFNKKAFEKETGIQANFVQDNLSKSSKGVLRGLHFQKGEAAQAKLVSVTKGKALDVCVDIRKASKTFGQYVAVLLDDVNRKQLYVPRGFAHGFLALEENTIFSYKCDNYYDKSKESGVLYNDPVLNINWREYYDADFIVSKKDKQLQTLELLF